MGVGAPVENLQSSNEDPQNTQSLDFIVPTEIVELPSKGLFYEEGHALYLQETVEIKHMTTKEEDILTNQSYIKNGTAIDRLLKSLLVDKRINVKDLLIGDKNAITIAARIYGYGADYETKYSCPSCGTPQSTSFDLSDVQPNNFEESLEEFDADIDYDSKVINFLVPRTKTKLQLKVLPELPQNKKQKNKKPVSEFFQRVIKTVNGNSDPRYVKSYIESMSALDSRYVRAAYQKIVPDVDMNCDFECEACGFETQVEVPLNAEFFWPK